MHYGESEEECCKLLIGVIGVSLTSLATVGELPDAA